MAVTFLTQTGWGDNTTIHQDVVGGTTVTFLTQKLLGGQHNNHPGVVIRCRSPFLFHYCCRPSNINVMTNLIQTVLIQTGVVLNFYRGTILGYGGQNGTVMKNTFKTHLSSHHIGIGTKL